MPSTVTLIAFRIVSPCYLYYIRYALQHFHGHIIHLNNKYIQSTWRVFVWQYLPIVLLRYFRLLQLIVLPTTIYAFLKMYSRIKISNNIHMNIAFIKVNLQSIALKWPIYILYIRVLMPWVWPLEWAWKQQWKQTFYETLVPTANWQKLIFELAFSYSLWLNLSGQILNWINWMSIDIDIPIEFYDGCINCNWIK